MIRLKILSISIIVLGLLGLGGVYAGLPVFENGETILTKLRAKVIGEEILTSPDPIRQGAGRIGQNTDGIYNEPGGDDDWIKNSDYARQQTLKYIKGLVNYSLGIIGLVALLYLIYHAFITLTAGSDSDKAKKGREGIRYAAIAIFGIGFSRLLVSGIFWLVYTFTVDL